MADIELDITNLPEDVREKLAELDLELSEGKSSQMSSTRCHFHIIIPISACLVPHFTIIV